MEEILIEVYVPAALRGFELRVPRAMNSLLCAQLAARAAFSLLEGSYLPSRSSILAWQESGALLNASHSLEQEHVINGSRLLLI